MMTGKKSGTAGYLTGIREGQTTSRAMAGSGDSGRRVNLRVAVDGSTTIRNAPFVHSVSDLYLSQLQQILQVSNPCALPVVKNSGTTSPKVTRSQSCWRQRTKSDGSGGTLSQPSCNRHRASPKLKLRHPSMSWLRKNSECNKASANERLLEKKHQRSMETVEMLRKQLQAEQDILGDSFRLYYRPRRPRNSLWMACVQCELLCMVLAPMVTRMHRDLRQWSRTPTCSNRKIQLLNESAKRVKRGPLSPPGMRRRLVG